jgi:hypothetical protein
MKDNTRKAIQLGYTIIASSFACVFVMAALYAIVLILFPYGI